MYLIDTNIIMEVLLGRKNMEECKKLFDAVQGKKIEAVCSHFSVHSICVFAAEKGSPEKCVELLRYLLALENLVVMNTTMEDDIKILALAYETDLDFDDALQLYIAKETGCDAIITFDRDFKGKSIRALTPKEAIASAE